MSELRPRKLSPSASRQRSTTPVSYRPSWNFSTKKTSSQTSSGGRQNLAQRYSPSPTATRNAAVAQPLQQHAPNNMWLGQQPHANPHYAYHHNHQQPPHSQQQPHYRVDPTAMDGASGNLGPSSSASSSSAQISLFAQLQDVVVRLSQAARADKGQLSAMTAKLDSYERLVREQDKMIDDLRAMNARLMKEKEALSSFRGGVPQPGALAAAMALDDDESAAAAVSATPKTRTFVQSLVNQLRDEKRHRYEVEEQSSRMIGEQQLTIHRLEERIQKLSAGPGGPQTPRKTGSTGSPTAMRAALSPRVTQPSSSSALHGGRTSTPVRGEFGGVATNGYVVEPDEEHDERNPLEGTLVERQLRDIDSAPPPTEVVRDIAAAAPPPLPTAAATSSSAAPLLGVGDSEMSMESAAFLLQKIRERHGL